jgi:formylglycine-generating enzyme required for sulfatase activity
MNDSKYAKGTIGLVTTLLLLAAWLIACSSSDGGDPAADGGGQAGGLANEIDSRGSSMSLVPAGTFAMGGDPGYLLEACLVFSRTCLPNAFIPSEPRHDVVLPAFYMDQFEVTNDQYVAFLNSLSVPQEGACRGQACLVASTTGLQNAGGQYRPAAGMGNHPVTGVTWYGAIAYCEWRGARLPTEAEWEKAATWKPADNSKSLYPWGDTFEGSRLNFCDNSCMQPQANPAYNDGFATTAPVGSYPGGRSAIGMYDMAGNVWEWVADWYNAEYYRESPTTNPLGPEVGETKVVRGGSWFDAGNYTISLFRSGIPPADGDETIGFRCALAPPAS